MNVNKVNEYYADFEIIDDTLPLRPPLVERWSEAILKWILAKLQAGVSGLAALLRKWTKKAGEFLLSLVGLIIKKLFGGLAEAMGKAVGYIAIAVLFFGLGLSFFANDYSLGRTFSWEGLKVLFETFK